MISVPTEISILYYFLIDTYQGSEFESNALFPYLVITLLFAFYGLIFIYFQSFNIIRV